MNELNYWLLRSGNQVHWVEVERPRKNAKDYKALLVWLGKVLQDSTRRDGSRLLGPGQAWGRVIFICTPAFEAKLRKARWACPALENTRCPMVSRLAFPRGSRKPQSPRWGLS